MTTPGCVCGPVSDRPAKAAASILSGLLVLLMPKCPLCIAAWLTVATGVGISAAGVIYVRAGILLLWMAALALVVGRRVSGRAGGNRLGFRLTGLGTEAYKKVCQPQTPPGVTS
ncbi:MAG: hypothetical protein QM757_40290 [Paludibaculum sp.]